MEFCIILQARLGSKRLPKKILKKIYNKESSLSYIIKRTKKFNFNLVVATTKSKKDDKIISVCKENNINFFRGSENNVFERYKKAAKLYKIKNIIRLTSDCPLIDFYLLNDMKKEYLKKKLDYICNTLPIKKSTFPNGSDIEIFKSSLLDKYKKLNKSDKEHVTNKFWKSKKIKKVTFTNNTDLSKVRYTLDYKSDLLVIKKILLHLNKNKKKITYRNISRFLIKNKKISSINQAFNNIFQGRKING
jgi:spore coat polysaccharide biosynthesis protein SpsF